MNTQSHAQAPDGYRLLLFRDLGSAQGQWEWTDVCYSCCPRFQAVPPVAINSEKNWESVNYLNLNDLQEAVRRGWTSDGYSEQFKASTSFYKDFDHALKHVRKAAQALENMTEAADHGVGVFDAGRVSKYIADIAISAARLANVSPLGIVVDLERAVVLRLKEKINPKA